MVSFGLIIIGDEILSGKRQDKHFPKVVELLRARGLELSWARYLGDDRGRLTDSLVETFASQDVVISCGGIGATPDDHTRQSAAAALGLSLVLHPEAERLITERVVDMAAKGQGNTDMTLPENRQRLKMGEFPAGSELIPNSYNKIPGFRIRNHWFVPGFPVMAWPMIEWLLETHYRHQFHRKPAGDRSVIVFELAESTVVPLMEEIERDFPAVKAYSLPSMGDDASRRHIELGVKGDIDSLDGAFAKLREGVVKLGGVMQGA